MEPEDHVLVEQTLAGEERAFEILLRRHQDRVYTLVRHMVRNPDDAAEITQDAFVKAFRALPRFDPQYTFKAWISKIASNLAIDFIRRKRLPTVSLDQPLELGHGEIKRDLPDAGDSAVEITEGMETEAIMENALQSLTPAHRQVLLLLYREQRSYEEISDMLEEPLGTIKARIHRAREALRRLVAPYFEEEMES